MPTKIEQLPGESIITATINEPFDPEHEVPLLFAELIRLRLATQGNVALIVDFGDTTDQSDSFSKMVSALAEAAEGIKTGKASGINRPPITIFVGSGPLASLAAQAIGQAQYGGVTGHLCASRDEALTLAREKLST